MSLLDQNRIKIAELENEYSELGLVREIQFNLRFYDSELEYDKSIDSQEMAERFVNHANSLGFKCTIKQNSDSFSDRYVTAYISLKISAESITELQLQLTDAISDFYGASLDGWTYTPKAEITFYPNCSASNKHAAASRASVLFENKLVHDPLHSKILSKLPVKGSIFSRENLDQYNRSPQNFHIIPKVFLQKALKCPPVRPEPTVSSFSQWIYSLYSSDFGTDEDRVRGINAEKDIWERRYAAISTVDNAFLKRNKSPWKLAYNGLNITENQNVTFFEIPELKVGGKPLRASPDLIYQNRNNMDVRIVEIKFSHLLIPKNLWPNIWAQLWCYSQIKLATSAPNVVVVGEVWGEHWSPSFRARGIMHGGDRLVSLRASIKRNPRATAYDRFFRTLFEIYSGSKISYEDIFDK